jgi:hypothetical protein
MTTSTVGLSPTAVMSGTTATVMMRLVRFFENTRKKVYYCHGEKYDKKAKI